MARPNTRTFYRYLAKEEGRDKWGGAPTESLRMTYGGQVLLSGRDRREASGRQFHKQLTQDEFRSKGPRDRHGARRWSFRELITESLEPVGVEEVRMAKQMLALRKAPGPDLFPSRLYKQLELLHAYVAAMIHLILKTGYILTGCRTFLMVALNRTGKDPALRESRRPISLSRTFMKIMEAALYTRMIRTIEPQ